MNANLPMHRRQLLGMLGGSAVLAAGCAVTPSAGVTPGKEEALDLEDIGSRIRTFVKAGARLSEGRAIWSTRAEVYAMLPPDQVVPLVRVKGCEQQWIRPLSQTEFLSFDNLLTYYCDFDSDQVIRDFKNPFTGARNIAKPNVSRMKEGREISPRGVVYRVMKEAYPDFYAGLEFDVLVRKVGESVSFQGENKWPAEFIRPPAGSRLTMFARLAELADPNLDSVPANFAGPRLDAVSSRGWRWRIIPATSYGTCRAIRSNPSTIWTRITLRLLTVTLAIDSNSRRSSIPSLPDSRADCRPWAGCPSEVHRMKCNE